jgi:anthranilate synthase component 1
VTTTSPSRDDFRVLARKYTVVPVWREVLADLITPVAAFMRLVGTAPGFLFESVEHGERWARFSFVGRNPSATMVARGGRLAVEGTLPERVPRDRGVLAAVEELLRLYRSPSLPELPPLHGGVVGYIGYDVVREVEHLPHVPYDDLALPDAVLSVIGQLAVFDHWRQRVTLIENVMVPDGAAGADDVELDRAYDEANRRLDALAADGARPLAEPVVEPPAADDPLPAVRSSVGTRAYCDAVDAAKELILAGDIFQVVLSQRFDLEGGLGAEPFDVYRVLRQVNPSPYMYFLRHPEVTVVGGGAAQRCRSGRAVRDRTGG